MFSEDHIKLLAGFGRFYLNSVIFLQLDVTLLVQNFVKI